MTDQIYVPVGDIAELIANAYDLIGALNETDASSAEVRHWISQCDHLIDRLRGNRAALKARVLEALGEASMCWDSIPTGVFQETNAVRIAEGLMSWIDEYSSTLPLMRHSGLMSREEDTPQERLAAAIYEISTRIGTGMIEKWSDAPEEIKHTLRATAEELIAKGFEAYSPTTILVDDQLTPEEKKLFNEAMYAADSLVRSAGLPGLPPNIPMPPGFKSDGGGGDG